MTYIDKSITIMKEKLSLQYLLNFYPKIIAQQLSNGKKRMTMGLVALTISLLYVFHEKLLKPPKNIRHIPYLGYFDYIRSIIKKESYWDRAHRNLLPMIDSPQNNGFYVRPGRIGWEVHVANPEAAKQVFLKHDKFPKADVTHGLEETLSAKFISGPNVVFLNGARWKSQRMVANPAFRRSMPVKLFGQLTLELFDKMEELGDMINISDMMERWTLEAIGRAGFGFTFNAIREQDNPWVLTYNHINKGLQNPTYFFFPALDQPWLRWMFPKRRAMHQDMDRFLAMLDDIIVHKREKIERGETTNGVLEESEKDLLTLMIEAEQKGEGSLSNEELKSNLCIFFVAGHDTTANALSYAIYYLAKYPHYQERARKEVLDILGDEPSNIIPTIDQIKQMVFINQIIKENLRIDGPVTQVVSRIATEDTVLSGTFIPKGTYVNVDIFNIHHSDKVWREADEFNPDRFVTDARTEGMSWTPFGNGARQCLGMNFSLAEQRVLLSMILRKYSWELPKNSIHQERVKVKGLGVNGPRDLEIQFKKRF
ncbi:MAG: cytochrome P450 [Benjaminiella poitrasii]|nr:MAG: cytochrome P450 [Benjaminiella poitrasii]